MENLKKKKYIGLMLIVVLVICLIALISYGRLDKYKGLVKVKKVIGETNTLSANISHLIDQPTIAKGNDEVIYTVNYTLDNLEGAPNRTVIIRGTLTDEESVYARFKEINGEHISSALSDNGKEIIVTISDVSLGVQNSVDLKLIINNAPNGFTVHPRLSIQESTESEETSITTEEVTVNTKSITGVVKDVKDRIVSNIELGLFKDGKEIKRTYSDTEGKYVFTDLQDGNYEIKVIEEIYESIKKNETSVSGDVNKTNITIREVKPYDIETHKYINKVNLVVNGKKESYTYDDLETVVQVVKNARTISGQITYKITVKNIGNKAGKLSLLKDVVEKGLSFDESKNSGWKEKDGNIYYTPISDVTINPNETREIGLRLDIKSTNSIKTYINEITANGETYEKVVYILNGEKYREENVILGEKITKPAILDDKFDGWYTDKNFTNKYNFENEVTKDLILYGKTNVIKHSVKFIDKDPYTKEESVWDEQKVEDGKKATEPNEPSHNGYEFECWMDSNDNIWNFNNPVEGDLVLTSCYSIIKYNITYTGLTNDEKTSLNNPTKYTIEDNITLNNPNNRTDGDGDVSEIFVGWTGSNGTSPSTLVNIVRGTTGDKTYNANFIEKAPDEYTITYNLDGGKLEQGKTNPNTYTKKTETFTLNNPSKPHYRFLGWTGTGLSDKTLEVTIPKGSIGNREYTAHYELITHDVVFNDYDPENPEQTVIQYGETVTVNDGNTVSKPNTDPEHTGYICDKWSTKINGNYNEDAYDFSSEVVADLTLYTLCKKRSYTVTFMDGENVFATETVKYKEKASMPVDSPSKEHNIFTGWTLNNELYDFNTLVTDNITLYSSYEEVEVPSVSHTPTEWTNQNVIVTITNKGTTGKDYTGYTYKYRVNNGEFINYTEPFEIEENCDIYVVSVKNGVNSVEVKHEITNIDKIKPIIDDLSNVTATTNSVTVSMTGHDNESGLKEFKLYLDDQYVTTIQQTGDLNEEKTSEYTFTSLEQDTDYTVKVVAVDVATNESDATELRVKTNREIRIVAQIIISNNVPLNQEDYVLLESIEQGLEYVDQSKGINCITQQCTIQMLDSVVETNDVLQGQDITLDLNGKTVKEADEYVFKNFGDFTIIDSNNEPGKIASDYDGIINTANATFTLGINDVEKDVSITAPFIDTKHIGVKNSGTFNFYDGKIKGVTAIDGMVNDTPVPYEADIKTELEDETTYQIATLKMLDDAEARIENKYYTQIKKAVEEAKTGEYQDIITETTLKDSMVQTGDYGFDYDENTNSFVSNNNVENTTASFTLDLNLKAYDTPQTLNIGGYVDSSNISSSWGGIDYYSENVSIKIYDLDNSSAVVSPSYYNNSSYNTSEGYNIKYKLEPEGNYRLEVIFRTVNESDEGTDTDSKMIINKMILQDYEENNNRLDGMSNVTDVYSNYGFDYDSTTDTIRSNNNYKPYTTAFSYLEVDLTNEESDQELIVNATLDCYGSNNYGFIYVKEDNNYEYSQDQYKAFAYMVGYSSNQVNYSGPKNFYKTLEAGKKYYIQFYYYKNSDYINGNSYPSKSDYDSVGTKDEFVINSIDIVPVNNNSTSINIEDEYLTNFTKGSDYQGNYYQSQNSSMNSLAEIYIPLDLTSETYNQVITLDANFYGGSNRKYVYVTDSKSKTYYNHLKDTDKILYEQSDYNTACSGNGSWSCDSRTSGKQLYKFTLQAGRKYYLHIATTANQNTYDNMYVYGVSKTPILNSEYDGERETPSGEDSSSAEPTEDGDDYVIDDGTVDKNFRYIGSNAKNYIDFNGETWRIIGIFKTKDENGVEKKRLKIVRDSFLPVATNWDSSEQSINSAQGVNEWSQAQLMKLLNEGYSNNQTIAMVSGNWTTMTIDNSLYWDKTSGYCFGGGPSSKTCDFSYSGLTSNAKNLIDKVVWNTGAINGDKSSYNAIDMYNAERGTATGKDGVTTDHMPTLDNVTRTTEWLGKVGLIYYSDYALATGGLISGGQEVVSRANCITTASTLPGCINTNDWMFYTGMPYFTITPTRGLDSSTYNPALVVTAGGPYGNVLDSTSANAPYYIKPAVYLSTKAIIGGGDGSSGSHYTVSLGDTDNPSSYYGLKLVDDPEYIPDPSTRYTSLNNEGYANLMHDRTIYGFTYDSETNTFSNTNKNITTSTASSMFTIDTTSYTEDLDLLIKSTMNFSDSNNQYGYIYITENQKSLINYDSSASSYMYTNNDNILVKVDNLTNNTDRRIILPKNKLYYVYLGNYNKATDSTENNDYQVQFIQINDTESTTRYDRYDGTNIILNEDEDTVQMLKDISMPSTMTIEEIKAMKLDLNGYTLMSESGSVIENNGKLTILDSSDISATADELMTIDDIDKTNLQVGYNLFDSSSLHAGTITDYSGSSNNGDYSNSAIYNDGLDLTSGIITFYKNNDSEFTFETTIKITEFVNENKVILNRMNSNKGYKISIDNNIYIVQIYVGNELKTFEIPIEENKNYTIALEASSESVALYLNGGLYQEYAGAYRPITDPTEMIYRGNGAKLHLYSLRYYNSKKNSESLANNYRVDLDLAKKPDLPGTGKIVSTSTIPVINNENGYLIFESGLIQSSTTGIENDGRLKLGNNATVRADSIGISSYGNLIPGGGTIESSYKCMDIVLDNQEDEISGYTLKNCSIGIGMDISKDGYFSPEAITKDAILNNIKYQNIAKSSSAEGIEYKRRGILSINVKNSDFGDAYYLLRSDPLDSDMYSSYPKSLINNSIFNRCSYEKYLKTTISNSSVGNYCDFDAESTVTSSSISSIIVEDTVSLTNSEFDSLSNSGDTTISGGKGCKVTNSSNMTIKGSYDSKDNCEKGIENSGTLTIGEKGGTVDKVYPRIKATDYAYKATDENANLNFYEGSLVSTVNNSLIGNVNDIEPEYEIETTTDILETKNLSNDGEYVAQIGSSKYSTLQAAINAVTSSNDEILILRDFETAAKNVIPNDAPYDININLNGKTITAYNKNAMIENNKVLKIYDAVNATNNIISNSNNEIINNGTLEMTNVNNEIAYKGNFVNNTGTIDMLNGSIKNGESGSDSKNNTLITNTGTIVITKTNITNVGGKIDNYSNITLDTVTASILGSFINNYENATLTMNKGQYTDLETSNSQYSTLIKTNNGTVNMTDVISGVRKIGSNNGSMTMTRCTFSDMIYLVENTGILSVKDGSYTLSTVSDIGFDLKGGTTTLDGLTLITNEESYAAQYNINPDWVNSPIYVRNDANLTIKDITGRNDDNTSRDYDFGSFILFNSTGVFNFEKGTITDNGSHTKAIYLASGTGTVNFGVTGDSDVSITTPHIIGTDNAIFNENETIINIYDGKFTGPTGNAISGSIDNVETGYVLYTNHDSSVVDSIYLIEAPKIIRNIDQNKEYSSIQLAVNEANNNDKFELMEDINTLAREATITIPSGLSISIDIKGHTINKTNAAPYITNNGTLTVTDSLETGSIISPNATTVFENNGTITIGKVICYSLRSSIILHNNENSTAILNNPTIYVHYAATDDDGDREVISNEGIMTINNILLKNSRDVTRYYKAGVEKGFVTNYSTGDLTINDFNTSFNLDSYTDFFVFVNNGTTTITGGNVTRAYNYGTMTSNSTTSLPNLGVMNKGTMIVDDATGTVDILGTNTTTVNNATDLSIGEFHNYDESDSNNITLTINGGSITEIQIPQARNTNTYTATINGGTIGGMIVYPSGTLNIKGGVIQNNTGVAIDIKNGSTVNLGTKDGTVSKTSPKIQGTSGIKSNNTNNPVTLNFYDGIIKSDKDKSFDGTININEIEEGADITTVYTDSDTKEEKYLSADPLVKNMTTNQEYISLNSAISNSSSGDTLKFLRNYNTTAATQTVTVGSSKSVTLDLNSYNISLSNSKFIENNGNLTVTGQGTISMGLSDGTIFENKGTLKLTGGKFKTNSENMITNAANKVLEVDGAMICTDKPNIIVNNGTFYMKSGDIIFGDVREYNYVDTIFSILTNEEIWGIDNKANALMYIQGGNLLCDITADRTYSEMIKNDGTIYMTSGTIYPYLPGNTRPTRYKATYGIKNNYKFEMTGGTFRDDYSNINVLATNSVGEAVYNSNQLKINGATIDTIYLGVGEGSSTVTIQNSVVTDYYHEGGRVNVSNTTFGTFNSNTSSSTRVDFTNCIGDTIYNQGSNKFVINGGTYRRVETTGVSTIKGNTTINNSSGTAVKNTSTVNIGEKDGTVSTTYPYIKGTTAAFEGSGTINFYDGMLEGTNYLGTNTLNEKEPGYKVNLDTTSGTQVATLRSILPSERVVTYNNINYESIQEAINSVPNNGTGDLILQVNYTLSDNLTVPSGKTINLYLNGYTFDRSTYTVSGTFNEISGAPQGVGGAIYRFLANLTGTEINAKDILIYQMQDGETLNAESTYKLYKKIDNSYKLVKVIENEIGEYEVGNKTDVLRTTNGTIRISGIGEGTYKLLSNELKELNFDVNENGVSSNIREDKYSGKAKVVSTSIATLILQLQTGVSRNPYVLIILALVLLILVGILFKKKKETN